MEIRSKEQKASQSEKLSCLFVKINHILERAKECIARSKYGKDDHALAMRLWPAVRRIAPALYGRVDYAHLIKVFE
jgi:hypothetical protein